MMSDEEVAADIEAVRRRLAERGLITTEPHLRIRDVAPAATPTSEPPLSSSVPEMAHNSTMDEPEEEPGFGPTGKVTCPACRRGQEVVIAATGFRCVHCAKGWRWATCTSCADLAVVMARQESWRCGGCGAYSRSWWRTTTAPRDGAKIADRKRHEAAAEHHARQFAIAKRRRWKLLVGGVVVVAAVALAATLFTSTDTGTPADRARLACDRFSRFKSEAANGQLSPQAIDAELVAIDEIAELARPDVQLAAATLAASGRPGDAAFLVAATAMSDACAKPHSVRP